MAKRPPIIMDNRLPQTKPGANQQVQSYKDGIAARAAAQREQRPAVPNLAQANELYKPGKDGPMTLAQIGEAQRRMESGETPKESGDRALSPQTIAGLQALHGAMQAQRKETPVSEPQLPTMPMPQVAPAPAASPEPVSAPAPAADNKAEDEKKARLRDTLSEMDDLEFDRVLRSVQQDAINNERERKAVKERVKPLDIIAGISTGTFTQDVPIIPDTLVVKFRTITAMENQAIRLMLFRMIDEDKRKENISAELYGLMQTVCAVANINNQALPPHIKGEGYKSTFDEEGFLLKFNQFIRFPLVLLHAIGTHGYWFEQRVREAFTADHLKNG